MVVRQNLEVFAPSALAVVGDSSPNGEGGRGAFQNEKSALGNIRFYVSTETFDSPYLQGGSFESRLALLQDGKKGPQEHVVDISASLRQLPLDPASFREFMYSTQNFTLLPKQHLPSIVGILQVQMPVLRRRRLAHQPSLIQHLDNLIR